MSASVAARSSASDEPSARPGWIEAGGLGPMVRGGMTTRQGGVSPVPYDSLDLRPAVLSGAAGALAGAVEENARRLEALLGCPPVWLEQVHGADCVRLGALGRVLLAEDRSAPGPSGLTRADASFTTEAGVACAVLVADCLPVLFAVEGGRAVAAAHAGWRGLAAGVLERTVQALRQATGCSPGEIRAWLGACIGPSAFEVGDEVLQAFGVDPEAAQAAEAGTFSTPPTSPREAFRFAPRPDGSARWRADLAGLARLRLRDLGLDPVAIQGTAGCTVSEPSRFFSYRRDGTTGRMAACIQLVGPGGT